MARQTTAGRWIRPTVIVHPCLSSLTARRLGPRVADSTWRSDTASLVNDVGWLAGSGDARLTSDVNDIADVDSNSKPAT